MKSEDVLKIMEDSIRNSLNYKCIINDIVVSAKKYKVEKSFLKNAVSSEMRQLLRDDGFVCYCAGDKVVVKWRKDIDKDMDWRSLYYKERKTHLALSRIYMDLIKDANGLRDEIKSLKTPLWRRILKFK